VRNTGENIDGKHCFDTLALTKPLPPTSKDFAPKKQEVIAVECIMPSFN
jgi:hypothetical protein